jgi:DNA-binding MarR family transcriptional regulator
MADLGRGNSSSAVAAINRALQFTRMDGGYLDLTKMLIIKYIDDQGTIFIFMGAREMEMELLIDHMLDLYHLIRRASHPVRRDEITQEQYWLMRRLNWAGAQSIGELADVLGITSSSATTACKRLEKAELVIRERQLDDERMVRVSLTETGRERIAAWQKQRRELLARLLTPLDRREQDELQHILEHMLQEAEDSMLKERGYAKGC